MYIANRIIKFYKVFLLEIHTFKAIIKTIIKNIITLNRIKRWITILKDYSSNSNKNIDC